jgi:hypothetical protein
MLNKTMLLIGSALPFLWGITHLFPTRAVVKSFGDISRDNKLILTMEWIVEGITLIGIGVTVFAVTVFGKPGITARIVYVVMFVMLNALSILSLLTGFRVQFLPYKLCPVIFTLSSIFILLGILL